MAFAARTVHGHRTIEEWIVELDPGTKQGSSLLTSFYQEKRSYYFDLIHDSGRIPRGSPGIALPDPFRQAVSLAGDGHLEDALHELTKLPPSGSAWADALRRIDVLVCAHHEQTALEELVELAARFPNRALIEYTLAQLHDYMRIDRNGAVLHAERAVDLLPCSGFRLLLAECLDSVGKRERAWDVLKNDRDRGSPRALRLLARLAEQLHPAEALSLWKQLVERDPEVADTGLDYAVALRRDGQPREAARHAWGVFERYHHILSAKALFFCGVLQDLGDGNGLMPDAIDRMKRVCDVLHDYHSSSPHAHAFRLELRLRFGERYGPAVDFSLLQQAGLATVLPAEDLAQLLTQTRKEGASSQSARWRLYEHGGISLDGLARVEHRPLGELILTLLDEEQAERFCSHFSTTPPVIDPTQSLELLLGEAELLLVAELDLCDALQAAMRRQAGSIVVPRDAWNYLRAGREVREPPTDLGRQAARLAARAHDMIRAGQEERWLNVRDWVELVGAEEPLPPPTLRDPSVDEALVLAPFERGLQFLAATTSKPGRWRVAVDYFMSSTIGHPLLIQLLDWSDVGTLRKTFSTLYRAQTQTMSFPAFMRVLASLGAFNAQRNRKLCHKLARAGFVDALAVNDLVELGLGDPTLARHAAMLAAQEHMARATFIGVAEPTQMFFVSTYVEAIFEAFLSMQRDDGLRAVDAGMLASALLERIELMGSGQPLLDVALTQVAAIVLDHPRAAVRPAPDNNHEFVSHPDTPTGRLWAHLHVWAGPDGHRHHALHRALRLGWRLLDRTSGDGGPLLHQIAPLALSDATKPVGNRIEGNESLAILSALWDEQPLSTYIYDITDGNASTQISYLDCIQHAAHVVAQPSNDELLAMDERYVHFRFPVPGSSGALRMTVPVEAAALRADPPTIRGVLEELRWMQGQHDGRTYRLLDELLAAPADATRRRAYARHTTAALWRMVRDDPSYLLEWPRRRDPLTGSIPCLEDLCEILHEPTDSLGAAQSSEEVLNERLNSTWSNLCDQAALPLFYQVMRLPGGLAASSVELRLQPNIYLHEVEAAIHRLEHPSRYPAGILATDVMFLCVATAWQPEVELRQGQRDLREIVPPAFAALIRAESGPPPSGSWAADEPVLLRMSAIVVKQLLAPHAKRGTSDYIWLTYRLYGWFVDQANASDVSVREEGLERIRRSVAQTVELKPPIDADLFDPFAFETRQFGYRLAVILFAMLSMEQLVRDERLTASGATASIVSSQDLEKQLAMLASRHHSTQSLASGWLYWPAPDNVSDLALEVLLCLRSEGIMDLDRESLRQRIGVWPTSLGSLPQHRRRLIDSLVRALAENVSKLDEDTRQAFEKKLAEFEEGELEQAFRWIGTTSLYASGSDDLEPTVRSLLQQHLTAAQAPLMASLFLQGLATTNPARLDTEVTSLYEAWRDTPERAVEVISKALARLVDRGGAVIAQSARHLLLELPARPGFRDDPKLKVFIERLGIERVAP